MFFDKLSRRIDRAFETVDRRIFMPDTIRHLADADRPFPIGFNQTISQPTTVRHMITWLDPEAGNFVLDVGSGSGWTTAIISHLVGQDGFVYAVERIPELKQFGESNCRKFGCENVKFFVAQDHLGLRAHAPYDRILVSAAASGEIPQELIDQLAPYGKLVVPVNNSIYELKKDDMGEIDYCREHPGYVFVPLIVYNDSL